MTESRIHDPVLASLFAGLEAGGLRWCLLRLPSGEGPRDGDIDLLVDPVQAGALEQAAGRQGFVRLPGWEPALHLVRYHAPSARWYWLHVVTELSFGPEESLLTGAASGCLERRAWQEGVPVLTPDDAFWALLLHNLLDKRRIAEQHRPRLRSLAARALPDSQLAQLTGAACPPGWSPERVLSETCAGNWETLAALSPRLIRNWPRRRSMVRGLALGMQRLFLRARNLGHARGLGVALLGPDGSGKSTLIDGMQHGFVLPVRPVYMGLTGGLLRYTERLRLPFLVIPVRLAVFWARYLAACYHMARGRLVVFDRYIYDSRVPTPYPLDGMRKLYRWIDGHILPAPDLLLILDAPGEVMFRRKGEYSAAMLEDWRQHFLTLREEFAQAEVIDTTRSAGQVRNEAIAQIWQRYAARWAIARPEETSSSTVLRTHARENYARGVSDAARLLREPAAAARLPLGRFNDLGMRGVLLRDLLLALHLPDALLSRLVSMAHPAPGSNGERFADSLLYWTGARDRLLSSENPGGRERWEQLTRSPRILMYHAIGGPGERAGTYIVPQRQFARQMAWLRWAGYRVIPLQALIEARSSGYLFPARSVVITFDDGYRDILERAAPVLRKHAFPATVFLVAGALERANEGEALNDWDEQGELIGRALLSLKEIESLRAYGFDLGGHGCHHRPLTELSPADLESEVRGSRERLEVALNENVLTFAYPHGCYNPTVQTALLEAGYALACSSDPGPCDPAVLIEALPRLEIRGTTSLLDFALALWLGKTRALWRLKEAQ